MLISKRRVHLPIALLSASLFAANLSTAEDWISLFDGETKAGWVQMNGEVSYVVEEGAIVGTSLVGQSPMSFLCTAAHYGDFELEFDVKLFDAELNSGVQIRSWPKATKPQGAKFGAMAGPQVEISAGKKHGSRSGYIYGQGWKGWITPDEAIINHDHFQLGEWNHYRVIARGPEIVTFLNEMKITETVVPADRHATHARGRIGLQVHGLKEAPRPFKVAWKNIRIKPMTPP
jgi:hypothetical protein